MNSVCLATYNGEKFIKQQLESVLKQINSEDEVIVSDDGSTDGTIDIVKSFNDKRIKIVTNSGQKGPSHNFENSIKSSSGEIIFLCDQDDVWLPSKYNRMVEIMAKNNCQLILSNCYVTDSNLNLSNKTFFDIYNVNKNWLKNFHKNSFLGCCLCLDRRLLKKALPFPKSKYLLHDYWIGMVAISFYNVKILDEPLMLYRRHDNNASPTTNKSPNSLLIKIKIRLTILLGLIKAY